MCLRWRERGVERARGRVHQKKKEKCVCERERTESQVVVYAGRRNEACVEGNIMSTQKSWERSIRGTRWLDDKRAGLARSSAVIIREGQHHVEKTIESPTRSPCQRPRSMVSGRTVSASRTALSSSRCFAAYLWWVRATHHQNSAFLRRRRSWASESCKSMHARSARHACVREEWVGGHQ